MKIWIERALAALRWGREKLVALAKVVLAKLHVIFNTVYDPPPRTIRFWFWSAAAIVVVCWLTFAFVNSWFYKPAVQALTDFTYVLGGDDGDVDLPMMEALPPLPVEDEIVAQEARVICLDASDTPQCVPGREETEGMELSSVPEREVNPSPKPKKAKAYKIRKHQPYQTYWGF